MNRNIALWSVIATLAGCAANTDSVERQAPQLGSVEMDEPDITVVQPAAPVHRASVELTLAATDESGGAIDVRACHVLARNPGDFTGGRIANSMSPGCGDGSRGLTRLAVDARSEVIVSIGSLRKPGYPLYITQLTTGTDALDVSHAPLRLLGSEHIPSIEHTQSVVVQTDVTGGVYELLLGTTEQGPAPIYLDAKGRVAPNAGGSVAGGWAVFANVPSGLHTVSFGHPTQQMQREPALGWASFNEDGTDVWVIPGFTNLVAIGRAD